MKHTLVALMQDRPAGVSRVTSLLRRRGFKIDSLSIGQSETPGITRLTLVVDEALNSIEQVIKQLYRLIEVIKINDITGAPYVARELVLIKVHAAGSRRTELHTLANMFAATVTDITHDSLVVELSANPERVEHLIDLLQPFGILELVRTGAIAMARGSQTHAADTHVRIVQHLELIEVPPIPERTCEELPLHQRHA